MRVDAYEPVENNALAYHVPAYRPTDMAMALSRRRRYRRHHHRRRRQFSATSVREAPSPFYTVIFDTPRNAARRGRMICDSDTPYIPSRVRSYFSSPTGLSIVRYAIPQGNYAFIALEFTTV